MEKNDPLLRDNVLQRSDPIGACAQVAQKLNVPYFALQKGGQCFVGKSGDIDYQRYSPSRKCKYGLGGQMANDVYMIKKSKLLFSFHYFVSIVKKQYCRKIFGISPMKNPITNSKHY